MKTCNQQSKPNYPKYKRLPETYCRIHNEHQREQLHRVQTFTPVGSLRESCCMTYLSRAALLASTKSSKASALFLTIFSAKGLLRLSLTNL
mmetsp:Transcript_141393/g.368206  ORF Transcript_141393/g.368206 Transcript_141393/m.368206 type:complete len:91 (+) Transcript_141393:1-273(+)